MATIKWYVDKENHLMDKVRYLKHKEIINETRKKIILNLLKGRLLLSACLFKSKQFVGNLKQLLNTYQYSASKFSQIRNFRFPIKRKIIKTVLYFKNKNFKQIVNAITKIFRNELEKFS